MAELATALRPPGNSGGTFEDSSYINKPQNSFRESLLRKLISNDQSDNDDGEFLFNKLKQNPHLRKSLSTVNKARAFKYGSRAFGHKKWYKEDFNIKEGLRSNKDRRKFRFGLKSNVDFLIQLDILNLKAKLLENSFNPQVHNRTPPLSLSDGSFLGAMNNLDAKRCSEVCVLLQRISDNLEFSRSLTEYFATDDMLEPALMLITETIRKDPNLRKNLHGGSFASNAMVYRHRASPLDHDTKFSSPHSRTSPGSAVKTTQKSTSIKGKKGFARFKYGYCFKFQHTDNCDRTDCEYLHKCNLCDETSHGEASCPDK